MEFSTKPLYRRLYNIFGIKTLIIVTYNLEKKKLKYLGRFLNPVPQEIHSNPGRTERIIGNKYRRLDCGNSVALVPNSG